MPSLSDAIAKAQAAHAQYEASRSPRDLILFDDACRELLRLRDALREERPASPEGGKRSP